MELSLSSHLLLTLTLTVAITGKSTSFTVNVTFYSIFTLFTYMYVLIGLSGNYSPAVTVYLLLVGARHFQI